MAPKGKPKARAFTTQSAKKELKVPPIATEPPSPFKRASAALEPLLPKLDTAHVYITSLDSKPRDFKQKIFLVPVFMNIAIIGLIIWRIRHIGPFYMNICFSLMGKYNETTIDTARLPMNGILKELLWRTGTFMIDLMIYGLVWPWPREFFAGRKIGNPISWRLRVGFREREIIIRRSRKWDVAIRPEGENSEEFFDIIKRAVDPMWMSEKTGYLMLNKEWDLEWKLIIEATNLVDKKTMTLEDFKTTILVFHEEFGWMVIESAKAGGSAKEEEGRRKIVAFKDELTALGKENLFFRWIELVQYESSRPGGFGPAEQKETMAKAKETFEAQGVHFDKFWAKVGGMEGMPGMDQM